MINDVLDLAKLDADKVEVEACDIAEVVHEALDLILPMAIRRGVAVADPPTFNRHVVAVDRRRLRQILVNLASNAVKLWVDSVQSGAALVWLCLPRGVEARRRRSVWVPRHPCAR